MNEDFYIILDRAQDGELYFAEQVIGTDMIVALENANDPVSVFELNPGEYTSDDITADIAQIWFHKMRDAETFHITSEGVDLASVPQFIKDNMVGFEDAIAEVEAAL